MRLLWEEIAEEQRRPIPEAAPQALPTLNVTLELQHVSF